MIVFFQIYFSGIKKVTFPTRFKSYSYNLHFYSRNPKVPLSSVLLNYGKEKFHGYLKADIRS